MDYIKLRYMSSCYNYIVQSFTKENSQSYYVLLVYYRFTHGCDDSKYIKVQFCLTEVVPFYIEMTVLLSCTFTYFGVPYLKADREECDVPNYLSCSSQHRGVWSVFHLPDTEDGRFAEGYW